MPPLHMTVKNTGQMGLLFVISATMVYIICLTKIEFFDLMHYSYMPKIIGILGVLHEKNVWVMVHFRPDKTIFNLNIM